ncbi:hypothetical protein PHLGIDRAFT_79417, partial [Phlebiopsis gigantea 11061_1 CR5-6]
MVSSKLILEKNLFWDFPLTDPYKAVSFDQLHWYHSGLFGHHLWGELKSHIRLKNMPRWRNLYHFETGALKDTFNDGSHYNDLSKVVVFASYNAFSPKETPRAYALLKLIRKFTECNMYSSLEVHTERTLVQYENAIRQFGHLLEQFTDSEGNSKNWDFVKAHLHVHAI